MSRDRAGISRDTSGTSGIERDKPGFTGIRRDKWDVARARRVPGAARRACRAMYGFVLHGAILTPAARAEHRTMVRSTRPATDEACLTIDREPGCEAARSARLRAAPLGA